MARLIANAAWLAALAVTAASAQQADPPEPESESESIAPPDETLILPPELSERPGAARLEPQPEERERALEIVIVEGRSEQWRLPDLGTELRLQREEEARASQRIAFEFLPLHDPENQDPTAAMFAEPDPRRVGFINLFEVGFGRRGRN